jgi:uncharacterized surface protein with fasciclin (FAS1) repeats
MSRELELLTEIRDLLLVIAEPELAKRDEKRRAALRRIAARGQKNTSAIKLMDGTRSQAAIVKEAKIDQGQLSRLVKTLSAESLIATDEKHPKLVVVVPKSFFDGGGESND